MPRKPKKPCKHPGCPKLVEGMYCEEHALLHGQEQGIQQCEGMTASGERQEKGFLNAILFVFSVRGKEGL